MKMKECRKCQEVKPISEFHQDLKKVDGVSNHCKDCKRANGSVKRTPKLRELPSGQDWMNAYVAIIGCLRCGQPLETSEELDTIEDATAYVTSHMLVCPACEGKVPTMRMRLKHRHLEQHLVVVTSLTRLFWLGRKYPDNDKLQKAIFAKKLDPYAPSEYADKVVSDWFEKDAKGRGDWEAVEKKYPTLDRRRERIVQQRELQLDDELMTA